MKKLARLFNLAVSVVLLVPALAHAQGFSGLYAQPLIGSISAAPLILFSMQRDARLYVEAYDDASDINGDGVMDTKYNPTLYEFDRVSNTYSTKILDYFGYFDSYKCYEYKTYSYNGGSLSAFVPIGDTAAGTKKCTNYTKDSTNLTKPWSGDFLNYLTTTRMDALRKVLYGGKRYIDQSYQNSAKTAHTVLERAFIPQDLHAFGKEYNSVAIDGYNIADYTPLSLPTSGNRHLFASVTIGKSSENKPPLLRILTNRSARAWDWIAAEVGGVANTPLLGAAVTPRDLHVRVVVCNTKGGDDQTPNQGADASGYCKAYGQGYKPTGILHDFGEQNSVYFGLMTGSSARNFSGGVLRKAISSFTNEVDPATGRFTGRYDSDTASVKGIVYTIDRMELAPFTGPGGGAYNSVAGESSSSNTVGNPIAEIMYEGLRYLAGASRTSAYWDGSSLDGNGLTSETPKLPAVLSWSNPYGSGNFGLCAKPTQMVISDVNPTFDSDQLPGSPWAAGVGFTGTLGSMNVSTLANSIWTAEGLGTKNIIIGEKFGGTEAGMPTAKSGVTGFSSIRGLAPEDTMWQGSYFAGAVAKFGKENDLRSLGNAAFSGSTITNRTVNTSVVALSAALPRIEVPITVAGTKRVVSVMPYAQTYSGGWVFAEFIKLFVDNIKNVPGAEQDATVNGGFPYYKLQVVFSDNSLYRNRGHDNDMDSRATYEVYWDNAASKVVVNVCADPNPASPSVQAVRCNRDGLDGLGYQATGVRGMHLGYTISGVNLTDGHGSTRLVVRGASYNNGTTNLTDVPHTLDLPSARLGGDFSDNFYNSTTDSSAGTATYRTGSDGKSLRFNHGASYSLGNSLSAGEFVPQDPLWYAAKHGGYRDDNNNRQLDSGEWLGDDGETPASYFKVVNPALLKEQITKAITPTLVTGASFAAAASNSTDVKTLTTVYQAKYIAANWSGRLYAYSINTSNGSINTTSPVWEASSKIPAASARSIFTYRDESSAGLTFTWASLNTTERGRLSNQQSRLDYIRGDRSNEGTGSSNFRVREATTVLGDIINSMPVYAGDAGQGYESIAGAEGSSYSTFVSGTKKSASRPKMIYVGANDGMLHGFRASDGVELFAYIPRAALHGDNASLLGNLADRTYAHRYFVDGPVIVNDFYDSTASAWKTALVGTMGAGGKSIFALDVTNPANFSTSNVMWEFSHPELGYVRSAPQILRLKDNNWYVVTGNGFESLTCDSSVTPRYAATSSSNRRPFCEDALGHTSRNAKLFIIKLKPDLSDGWTYGSDYFVLHATDVQSPTTPPSVSLSAGVETFSNGSDNGLSGPTTKDGATTNVDFIYAGDLQGNIWKFDVSNTNPASWHVEYKLFQAKDASGNTQPITTKLAVGTNPADSAVACVAAGTGRFVYEGDLTYKGVQSTYGVMDKGVAVGQRSTDLQEFTVVDKRTETVGSQTWNLVYVSSAAADPSKKGWFMDLREPVSAATRNIGERIIQPPIMTRLRTNELKANFLTSIPTGDVCDASGKSYSLDFNACTGVGLSIPTFDLNGNLKFDSGDLGTPASGSRLAGVQVGAPTGAGGSSALCFESPTGGVSGCSFDIGILTCTDGRIETIKKPPTSTVCGVKRTSWRQLR